MSLRIGFDLDGVLADFGTALRPFERNVLGPRLDSPDAPRHPPGLTARERTLAWRDAERTFDFWTTLEPFEEDALPRLQAVSLRRRWEVVFITQRPWTVGATVQRQTQRWLVEHGFARPTVVVHTGSRGKLADALGFDFLVDDTVQHCVDALAESDAKPILVLRSEDAATAENAERLGIEVFPSVGTSLDFLEMATRDVDSLSTS